MARTEPIRDPEQVRALLNYYKGIGEYRNYVLITLGIYTALRVSDILSIRCDDVYDFRNHRPWDTITVREMKTGKIRTIALHSYVIKALELYYGEARRGSPLIVNEKTGLPISRIQAYRIIDDAAKEVEIPQKVSCHSLRKTFGYHAWNSGISPVLLMEIFNHTSYAVTKRYLGVTQDDQNTVYLNMRAF